MLEPSDIKKLFAVLQARYGQRWTSVYDDPALMRIALSEWHRELKGLNPEDIRRGLTALDQDWPPTLPQFVTACRPRLHASHRPYKALPEPEREPDYPDDADFAARLIIERERMAKMGKQAYIAEAFDRMREMARKQEARNAILRGDR